MGVPPNYFPYFLMFGVLRAPLTKTDTMCFLHIFSSQKDLSNFVLQISENKLQSAYPGAYVVPSRFFLCLSGSLSFYLFLFVCLSLSFLNFYLPLYVCVSFSLSFSFFLCLFSLFHTQHTETHINTLSLTPSLTFSFLKGNLKWENIKRESHILEGLNFFWNLWDENLKKSETFFHFFNNLVVTNQNEK